MQGMVKIMKQRFKRDLPPQLPSSPQLPQAVVCCFILSRSTHSMNRMIAYPVFVYIAICTPELPYLPICQVYNFILSETILLGKTHKLRGWSNKHNLNVER